MKDHDCVEFLQWALPRLRMRWPGFRKVRRQVCKRVQRRLGELGLTDAAAYRAYLAAHPDEWDRLDGFCRISISRFYRDRGVFDYLRDEVLPRLADMVQARGERHVRCWSAGCASGEEVYTLNILWHLSVGPRFPDLSLSITATDSDPHMLDRARRGCYAASSLKDVPRAWLAEAFLAADDLLSVKEQFRGGVEFVRQDMRHSLPEGQFHFILCRHVAFTYFDEPLQCQLLERLLDKLTPGGVLMTGKQEPLPCLPAGLVEYGRGQGIYRKRLPGTPVRLETGA